MSWFKRKLQGITTSTNDKLEAPDGIWFKCIDCKSAIPMVDLKDNVYVCPKCEYHSRIGSKEYFEILFEHFIVPFEIKMK